MEIRKVELFKKNGWLLEKQVFSPEEINQYRNTAGHLKAINHKGDLLSNELSRQILFDERILNTAKQVLGTEEIVYFGDSHCVIDDGNKGTGFHKDNPDKINGNGPDWQSEYPVVRLGIYLQNHKKFSGSLAIRHKSHHSNNLKNGKAIYVDNEPGDLSMWYLTTTHAGYAKRLRLFSNTFVPPILYKYIPNAFFLPEEKLRMSFFMTFAKKHPLTERYLRYLKTRKYMVETWMESKYDSSALAFAESKGVTVINMFEEASQLDFKSLNDRHVELPN